MSNFLLEEFIRLILVENPDARVPTQLLSPDEVKGDKEGKDHDVENQGIEEFSGAGAIAGYTLPLGMNPDAAGRRKNKSQRKK